MLRAEGRGSTQTCFYWRSEGGTRDAGSTGRHLLAAANGRKLFLKNSRENSDRIISYVVACNKNKALQLQRVPILSIVGCNIDLYFKQTLQFPKPIRRKGGKFDHRPSGQGSCHDTDLFSLISDARTFFFYFTLVSFHVRCPRTA